VFYPERAPFQSDLGCCQSGSARNQSWACCFVREWRDAVGTAKALGMYDVKVISAAGGTPLEGLESGFAGMEKRCQCN